MSHRGPQAAAAFGLLLALAPGKAIGVQSVCLTLQTEKQGVATYPIAVGEALYLSFRHSVYGSEVEEQFQIARGGFRSIKVRYAELRLVEFYGHESATNEDGWWVIHNPGREFPSLDISVSRAASIRIIFLDQTIFLQHHTAIEGRARLSVSACPRESHG